MNSDPSLVLRVVNPRHFITSRWLTDPPSNPFITLSRYNKKIEIFNLNKDLWSSFRKVIFSAHTSPIKKNSFPLFFYILNIHRQTFTLVLEKALLDLNPDPKLHNPYRVCSFSGPLDPPPRITDPRRLLNFILAKAPPP